MRITLIFTLVICFLCNYPIHAQIPIPGATESEIDWNAIPIENYNAKLISVGSYGITYVSDQNSIRKWDGKSWSSVALPTKFGTAKVEDLILYDSDVLHIICSYENNKKYVHRWSASNKKWENFKEEKDFDKFYIFDDILYVTASRAFCKLGKDLQISCYEIYFRNKRIYKFSFMPINEHEFFLTGYSRNLYKVDLNKGKRSDGKYPAIEDKRIRYISGWRRTEVKNPIRTPSDEIIKVIFYKDDINNDFFFGLVKYDRTKGEWVQTIKTHVIDVNSPLNEFWAQQMIVDKYDRIYIRYDNYRQARVTENGYSLDLVYHGLIRFDPKNDEWKSILTQHFAKYTGFLSNIYLDQHTQNMYVPGDRKAPNARDKYSNNISYFNINDDVHDEKPPTNIRSVAGENIEGTALTINGAVSISSNDDLLPTPIPSKYIDDYSLWVEKGIVSEDFIISDPDYWGDHVFREDYDLMPLNDLKKFIQSNGHLPGIPSEKEIVENGYELHDINQRFMVKIEELTLYRINQFQALKENEKKLKIRLKKLRSIRNEYIKLDTHKTLK